MTDRSPFALPAGFAALAIRPLDVRGSLYNPKHEHDACGVGFVADTSGVPSHRILATALECVTNLTHRGAISADGRTGDGAGVTTQIPYRLLTPLLERKGIRLADAADLGVGMA